MTPQQLKCKKCGESIPVPKPGEHALTADEIWTLMSKLETSNQPITFEETESRLLHLAMWEIVGWRLMFEGNFNQAIELYKIHFGEVLIEDDI